MAGEIEFLRELEAFLDGLDWVDVKYARIAAGGAVDLGVMTDQRARLHVDLVARFGAGRVNIAAQAQDGEEAGHPARQLSPPVTGGQERLIDGWSVDESGRWLTLHFMAGGPSGVSCVELRETAAAVELRLLLSSPSDGPVAMHAWPDEIRVELATPIGHREVLHAGGHHHPSRYRIDGDDVIDENTGRRVYRLRSTGPCRIAPTRHLSP